ncbi:hypothetical protein BC938DRAFT_481225, partial [Jimgerdemannia flammicorona]
DILKIFAQEIETIGIIHGKLAADFYTLDLPTGSILDTDDAINISEMLVLIVNVLKYKCLKCSMAIKSKAISIVSSNHLQYILSRKKRLSQDSEIMESITLSPILLIPSK